MKNMQKVIYVLGFVTLGLLSSIACLNAEEADSTKHEASPGYEWIKSSAETDCSWCVGSAARAVGYFDADSIAEALNQLDLDTFAYIGEANNEAPDDHFAKAIRYAIKTNNQELANVLLQYDDRIASSLLACATDLIFERQKTNWLEFLIEHGKTPEQLLQAAIDNDSLIMAKWLLDLDDVVYPESTLDSGFAKGVVLKNKKWIDLFIDKGCNIDVAFKVLINDHNSQAKCHLLASDDHKHLWTPIRTLTAAHKLTPMLPCIDQFIAHVSEILPGLLALEGGPEYVMNVSIFISRHNTASFNDLIELIKAEDLPLAQKILDQCAKVAAKSKNPHTLNNLKTQGANISLKTTIFNILDTATRGLSSEQINMLRSALEDMQQANDPQDLLSMAQLKSIVSNLSSSVKYHALKYIQADNDPKKEHAKKHYYSKMAALDLFINYVKSDPEATDILNDYESLLEHYNTAMVLLKRDNYLLRKSNDDLKGRLDKLEKTVDYIHRNYD